MTRVLAALGVLLRTAWRGLRASPVTSGVAVLTIAISLVLVGAFGLLVTNMQGLLDRFGREIHVTAYLEDDLAPAAQRELADRVATVEGVAGVDLVTQADALARFQDSVGGAALLEGLDENPLPASLELSLHESARDPASLDRVVEALTGLPGVAELAYGQEWVEGYSRALALVRVGAVGLGGVLAFAALLIVANTIRLAVYARQDELEILSLVGASRSFVRAPFLLEGLLQGAVGGLVALVGLYAAFRLLLPSVAYGLEFFLGSSTPRFFDAAEMGALVCAGAVLGVTGSLSALLGWRA
ncbi:MAG: permease-like cell division protein FtsX [Proteobacteria bacterium]|nr:permease-like cell division protein FtsX [Pseudomonadota bacterium]